MHLHGNVSKTISKIMKTATYMSRHTITIALEGAPIGPSTSTVAVGVALHGGKFRAVACKDGAICATASGITTVCLALGMST
jgi:hypothetical protein